MPALTSSNVACYDRTRRDDRARADPDALQNNCTSSNMDFRCNLHRTTQDRPRRNMRVIANRAIMLDRRPRIHDSVLANPRSGLDNRARHDLGTVIDCRSIRYDRSRMNDWRERAALIAELTV